MFPVYIYICTQFTVPIIVDFNNIPRCHLVPLSAVRRMDIYDEQTTTMRVRWEEAEGATGYMLLYSAINATQPTLEQEVREILGKHWVHTVTEQKGMQPVSCGHDRFEQRENEHMHMCLWADTIAHACMHSYAPNTS